MLGKVNNRDYLVIMPSVSGGIYQGVSEHVVLKIEESLETGKWASIRI